ncbi:MAG: NAD-dependent epimerase/dehydratase family protein [Verrucomicrobia bacterium]|nr:NAD-dependent epimerase/dehydratase family protein [Verrucomicrobiota bacterium]
MKSILITGGCGFIGSNLAVAFRHAGAAVTVFDNLSRRGSELLMLRVLDRGGRFVRGDIRAPEDLDRLEGDFDLLIECSAEPSVLVGTQGADARFMLNNNLVGSLNCFEWARARRVPVLFLSTSRVYPYDAINARSFRETRTRFEPAETAPGFGPGGIGLDFPLAGARSLYGATKLASEIILQEYARQYDLPALIDRCSVLAGPWQLGKVDQGVFTHWLACHYFNKPLTYIGFGGHGKQVRDLLHVEDLADLVLKQAARIGEFRGEIFQVGGSVFANLSLCETTEICRALTGHRMDIGMDPADRPADLRWFVMDNGGTPDRFDWRPHRGPKQILKDTYDWLRQHEASFKKIFTP